MPLSGAWGMLWAGGSVSGSVDQWISGSVDQWISGSVRDVCMSHQSDWIYHQKPVKFPVVKTNGM